MNRPELPEKPLSKTTPEKNIAPLRRLFFTQVEIKPIEPPRMPRLDGEPFISRATLVVFYQFGRFEYWLSPDGGLQAWLRLIVRAGLQMNAFLLLGFIGCSLLAALIGAMADVANDLAAFALGMMLFIFYACGAVVGLMVFGSLLRAMFRQQR